MQFAALLQVVESNNYASAASLATARASVTTNEIWLTTHHDVIKVWLELNHPSSAMRNTVSIIVLVSLVASFIRNYV